MVVRGVMGFRIVLLGIPVSKFHELVPVVENKDPHRLHPRLEQTPSESHFKNSTRHTLLWGQTEFFSRCLWQVNGGRVTVSRRQGCSNMYPFFITCDNSPDKSIYHGITDKLITDIHPTLSLLGCQFMRYRFSKCLNLVMYWIFWRTKFFWQHTSTFIWGFSSTNLRIFSISHNFGLPERGKSLVFSSPVLKRWNHPWATRSQHPFSFHFTYFSSRGSSFIILFAVVL